MFRKISVSMFFFVGIIIVIGGKVIVAQNAPVSGKVELKKDGKTEPVAGATVELFRQEKGQDAPVIAPIKTGAKGEFSFAGLQSGGTYILAISCTGCQPQVFPGVKGGQQNLVFNTTPGDGRQLNEEEVRIVAGRGPGNAPSADEKKAQAEYEAKKKEIEDKNKKAEQTNQIVATSLKAGNEAFQAKNYDAAISQYDQGIAADPNFVGSAPIFHNNRSTALMSRAVDTYNKAVKMTDATEKVAGLTSARKDLADSAAGYLSSWTVLKNAPAADIADKANYEAAKLGTLRGARDTFRMAVRTEQVDPAVIDAAKMLIPEYVAVEPDAAKKAEANLIFADLYRVVGDSENAITAYKKILETSTEDVDALAGVGLSLVNLGYINNDKTKMQEGSNYLQKYSTIAPDGHKFKADAVALIETLKKEQNVTPQKLPTPPRRRP